MSVAHFILLLALCGLTSQFVSCRPRSTPSKPVWPTEFTAQFGLYDFQTVSPILNSSSTFLYSYNSTFQASLISYPYRCIPIYPFNDLFGCRLYFVNNNTYFSSPSYADYTGIPSYQCCDLIPGVGPVPPTFLQGFNYSQMNSESPKPISAFDYFGVVHTTLYWEGQGFFYWTDSQTGHDVFFNDGSSGTYWAWDPNFDVGPQNPNEFQLPGNEAMCQQACPTPGEKHSMGTPREMAMRDPMVKMAATYHGKI